MNIFLRVYYLANRPQLKLESVIPFHNDNHYADNAS